MFEQLRRKRMLIEESVNGKRNERDGMSSAERRQLVQKDLKQYNHLLNKTMQDFRKISQQHSPPNPNKTLHQKPFIALKQPEPVTLIKEQAEQILTPSVKDISPSVQHESALVNQFYELSAEPQDKPKDFSPNKNVQNFYKKDTPAPIPAQRHLEVNIQSMEQQSSHRESEQQIEDEQIKYKVQPNESKAGSNNSSDAIFFTSQFKQIMNNQMTSPLRTQNPQPVIESLPLVQQVEKTEGIQGTGRFQQVLKHNPSGQSLALSNDSSLKYSFNQSAIQDIITRKLSQELVVDSMRPSALFRMSEGLLVRENIHDIVQLAKTYSLTLFLQKNSLRSAFLELMVNREMKLQQQTKQLKAISFCEQHRTTLMYACFLHWYSTTKAKQEGIQALAQKREIQLKEKAFRSMKMKLFDRRIYKHIDNYFLSKIFTAFRNVTEKESKKMNQKAYRQYFKHLRRRMFQAFIEGFYNARRERELIEAADSHLYFSIIRKYFQGWRAMTPKQEKFVRLAMTTKNQLRETADKRLLQTRTFDFYEIK